LTWVESSSRHFAARHEEDDSEDVVEVLEMLESTRDQLTPAFPRMPGTVSVVIHASDLALAAAQPMVPVMRRLSAPAARRYIVGWPERDTIHVLAPRVLAARATSMSDSRQMGFLSPAALYAQIVVGHNNEQLPPPIRMKSLRQGMRWAWLYFGAGQYLSGQTQHQRAPIARRLREGSPPTFPPTRRDAPLLGGSLVDLIGSELGDGAVMKLVTGLPTTGPRISLVDVFEGLTLEEIEAGWRKHLDRMASA
jgi:hypothetical protein